MSKGYKAPKPFAFAVKSSENPTLFENSADFVHTFSCNVKEGETWLQAIVSENIYIIKSLTH